VWDLRNRLVGLDANGDDDLGDPGDATFAYDHEGTRVRRSVNIDTDEDGITDAQDETHFLQDKNNHTGCSQVLEEKSSLTAAPDRSYLIGLDIIAQAIAATVHHLLYDAGGSTRGLLDATGQPVTDQIYAYDAFGNRIEDPQNPIVVATPLLYRGEYFDAVLGQYQLRARYYDSSIGSFSSLDSYEGIPKFALTLHKYLYGSADPIMNVDPTGHFSLPELKTAIYTIARVFVRLAPKVAKVYQFVDRVHDAYRVYSGVRDIYFAASDGFDDDDYELIGGYVAAASIEIIFDALVGRAFKLLGPVADAAGRRLQERIAERLAKNAVPHSITRETIQATREWFRANKARYGGRTAKNGVQFDKNGFPVFEPKHLHPKTNSVRIELTGDRKVDEAFANRVAGFGSTPEGYLWHHHQQLGVMQLVKKDIHEGVGHSGGAKLWDLLHGTFCYE
jgi:RHS repeat-associated protein